MNDEELKQLNFLKELYEKYYKNEICSHVYCDECPFNEFDVCPHDIEFNKV